MPKEVAVLLDGWLQVSDHIDIDEYRYREEPLERWHDRVYKRQWRERTRFED